jgi:hypothetical protein
VKLFLCTTREVGHASGRDYRFGGRTSKVHTRATKIFLFREGDALSGFGKIVRQWNACLSGTDN